MATTARTITATPLAMPKLKRNHMAQRPAYSTVTPKRQHLMMVEWESDLGGRWWSRPILESNLQAALDEASEFTMVSDIDHCSKCWCQKEA